MTRVKLWILAVMATSVAYGAAPAGISISLVMSAIVVTEMLMLERAVQRLVRERVADARRQ